MFFGCTTSRRSADRLALFTSRMERRVDSSRSSSVLSLVMSSDDRIERVLPSMSSVVVSMKWRVESSSCRLESVELSDTSLSRVSHDRWRSELTICLTKPSFFSCFPFNHSVQKRHSAVIRDVPGLFLHVERVAGFALRFSTVRSRVESAARAFLCAAGPLSGP